MKQIKVFQLLQKAAFQMATPWMVVPWKAADWMDAFLSYR